MPEMIRVFIAALLSACTVLFLYAVYDALRG